MSAPAEPAGGDDRRPSRPEVPSDHVAAAGGVDCATVLADVFLYLDGEADRDVTARIRAHLDECGPCLRKFGVEREVKALIARSCGGDRAPRSLVASIRTQLTQVSDGQMTVYTATEQIRRSV